MKGYNDIAHAILTDGMKKFKPTKYNIEFRKSKTQDELIELINSINNQSTDFESKVTLLSISLKNFFKKLRMRKYTVLYTDTGKIKVDQLTTQKIPSVIKRSTKNFIALMSGHCKLELI